MRATTRPVEPPARELAGLPENEHLTMEVARRFGLDVPATTLLGLRDGPLAYLIEGYDRPSGGGELRPGDFRQLLLLPPTAKHDRTALD